jgi:hypothetical protein
MSHRNVKTVGTPPSKKVKITALNGYRVGEFVDWYPSKNSIIRNLVKVSAEIIGFTKTTVHIQVFRPGGGAYICRTQFESIQKRKETPNENKEGPAAGESLF